MKDEIKINLADVKVLDIGATCIMLVSKFSRIIKAKHGITIQLRDPQVLNKVAAYASATNNAELKHINAQIQDEMRKYFSQDDTQVNKDIVFSHKPLLVKKKSKTKVFRRM